MPEETTIFINKTKLKIDREKLYKKYEVLHFEVQGDYLPRMSLFDDLSADFPIRAIACGHSSNHLFVLMKKTDSKAILEVKKKARDSEKVRVHIRDERPDKSILGKLLINGLGYSELLPSCNIYARCYIPVKQSFPKTIKGQKLFLKRVFLYPTISKDGYFKLNVATFRFDDGNHHYKGAETAYLKEDNTLTKKKNDSTGLRYVRRAIGEKSIINVVNFQKIDSANKADNWYRLVKDFNDTYKDIGAEMSYATEQKAYVDEWKPGKKEELEADLINTFKRCVGKIKINKQVDDDTVYETIADFLQANGIEVDDNAKFSLNLIEDTEDDAYEQSLYVQNYCVTEGEGDKQHVKSTVKQGLDDRNAEIKSCLNELTLKSDVANQKASAVSWDKYGFDSDYTFILPRDYGDLCLTIAPDGNMTFKHKLEAISEKALLAAGIEKKKCVMAVGWRGHEFYITDPGMNTVPRFDSFYESKVVTQKQKRVGIRGRGKTNQALLDAGAIPVKSDPLGFIYQGLTGVGYWFDDGALYYYVGEKYDGPQRTIPRWNKIRKIVSPDGGDTFEMFKQLVPTMKNGIVRNKRMSVFPIAMKYLLEYERANNLE